MTDHDRIIRMDEILNRLEGKLDDFLDQHRLQHDKIDIDLKDKISKSAIKYLIGIVVTLVSGVSTLIAKMTD